MTEEDVTTTDTQEDESMQVSRLDSLKARAKTMGISFSGNIGEEALAKKIADALAAEDTVAPDTQESEETPAEPEVNETPASVEGEEPKEESLGQKKARLRREQTKMVRIRISCHNPNKKEWSGEIFTVSNGIVGTVRKYVPFDNDEGWHVPEIMYQLIKERQCQIMVNKRENGRTRKEAKLIREFSVEVLPPLTESELKSLAQRQAMANGTEEA